MNLQLCIRMALLSLLLKGLASETFKWLPWLFYLRRIVNLVG